MLRDEIVFGVLVVAFAALVTVHVAICAALVHHKSLWRLPIALVVFPLAPYWAWRQRMHVRALAWIGALVAYALARILAAR